MAELTSEGDVQELSNDLPTITAEINAYKRVAGEAIFEIGRRLKHVKENDLAHGEFGKWLESVGIHERQAQRIMKVYTELGGSNTTTSSEIALNVLYEIATLPPEERTKTHTTSKGEEKKPEDMTVKELREVKEQLKEQLKAEQDRVQRLEKEKDAERSERERLEELASKDPEVEYKIQYVETVPEDYERLRQENEEFRSKYGAEGYRKVDNKAREEFYREFASDLERIKDRYGSLILEAGNIRKYTDSDGNVGRVLNKFNDFWEEFSKALFKDETIIEMESVQ